MIVLLASRLEQGIVSAPAPSAPGARRGTCTESCSLWLRPFSLPRPPGEAWRKLPRGTGALLQSLSCRTRRSGGPPAQSATPGSGVDRGITRRPRARYGRRDEGLQRCDDACERRDDESQRCGAR